MTVRHDRKNQWRLHVSDRIQMFADILDRPRRPIHAGAFGDDRPRHPTRQAMNISPVTEQVSCASQPTTGATSSGPIGG